MHSIKMLKDDRRDNKLPERSVDMIILLTDGMPNEGGCTEKSKYICDDSLTWYVICLICGLFSWIYLQYILLHYSGSWLTCLLECLCDCVGETDLQKIQQNVCEAIGGNITLFCLGFGDDVDYSFLDVMAKQNNGVARRIYEASDATLQLQVCLC